MSDELNDPTRGLGLVFLNLAEAVGAHDKELLAGILDRLQEKLDKEAARYPGKDLRLGYEFVELADTYAVPGDIRDRLAAVVEEIKRG